MQSFIAKSVDNYYSVNNKTLEYYNYLKHDNGSIFEPKVSVTPLSYEDFVSTVKSRKEICSFT